MSTFYLFVEIHDVRQIQKIKPAFIGSVERNLLSLLESRGLVPVHSEAGLYFLVFHHTQTPSLAELIDASFSAHRFLITHRDDLTGFLLYLHVSEDADHEAVLRTVRSRVLSVDIEEPLILSDEAATVLENFVRVQRNRGFWIAEDQAFQEPSLLGEAATFCRHPVISKPLQAAVEQFWDDDWEPGILLVHGPRLSGKRHNFLHVVEGLVGAGLSDPYLDVFPGSRRRGPYAPLLNSASRWNLSEVPIHLSRHERSSWDERHGLLESILGSADPRFCPDTFERDLQILYGLLVQSFVRRMDNLLLPAFMACDAVQSYSSGTLEVLAMLFKQFLPSHVFMPVLLSEKPYLPPELRDFPYRKLRVPTLSDAKIQDMSSQFVTGTVASHRSTVAIREESGGRIGSIFYLFYNLRRGAESSADLPEGTSAHTAETERAGDSSSDSEILRSGQVPPALLQPWLLISGLNAIEQTVLYAAMLSWEVIDGDRLAEILGDFDIPTARVREVISSLSSMGLTRTETCPCPTMPELEQPLHVLLDRRAEEIRSFLARKLYAQWKAGELGLSRVLFDIVRGVIPPGDDIVLFRSLVRSLLDRRQLPEAFDLLYPNCPYDLSAHRKRAEDELSAAVVATVLGLRLRLALLAGDRHGADGVYGEAGEIAAEPVSVELGDMFLQVARYAGAHADQASAQNLIKRAILIYQDAGDRRGLSAAHTEFGLVMLAGEQLADAREYFSIAAKNVDPGDFIYEYVRASTLEIVGMFVYGALTRVNEHVGRLSDLAEKAGMREWTLLHRFIRARSLFEFGRYEEAGRDLEHALTLAQVYQNGAAYSVLLAWLARCLAYTRRPQRAIETLEGLAVRRETLFFRAEAYILEEKFAQALPLLEDAISFADSGAGRTDEVAQWTDGFSDLEDLAVGGVGSGGVLLHMVKAFHGYALARDGHRIEGIAELHRLTREERVSPLDPYNHLYYYLYGTILPDARETNRDPSFEDRLTVLGKAVRNLQERLGRMEQYADNISYQRQNLWNRLLFDEARAHNLL